MPRRLLQKALGRRMGATVSNRSGELLEALLDQFRYEEAEFLISRFMSVRDTMPAEEAADKYARLCALLERHGRADTTRAGLPTLDAMLAHQRGMHACWSMLGNAGEALRYRHSLLLMRNAECFDEWHTLALDCLAAQRYKLAVTALQHGRRIVTHALQRQAVTPELTARMRTVQRLLDQLHRAGLHVAGGGGDDGGGVVPPVVA